jgi:phage-related tail protein
MLNEKTRKIFATAGASANFAGMMIAMQDPDSKGLDDKAAKVIQGVGTGFSHAAEGDFKSAADVLDTASVILADLAKQLRAGKSPDELI